MKILFLTDNFPPEVNAPATRTLEHCREWVKAGADVTVITCAPNFPGGRVFGGYRNSLFQEEYRDGVRVIRVWSYIAPNQGFGRRILDYISFALSSFVAGLFCEFDIVIATSPQFFTTWAGMALSTVKRRPWVFELRDLWPDSILATGSMQEGFVIEALERIELDLYRNASLVIALTDAFRSNLVARGIPERKVAVVPNGVYSEVYERTVEQREKDLSDVTAPEQDRRFVVSYVGTHGLAHGLEVVLEAASLVRNEPFEFLMVGDGARRESLVREAADRGLTNVEFRSPVPKEQVPSLLAGTDFALVPLRRSETFKTVIPSKIFEAAAARRPIVLGVEGQAKELVKRYNAGVVFEPENANELVEALRRLAEDRELRVKLSAGCQELARDFDRGRLAQDMLGHLRRVAAMSGSK